MPAVKDKLNKEWHLANPMPKNASLDERIAWHLQHFKYCGCRDIPPKLKEEMKRRKLRIPV